MVAIIDAPPPPLASPSPGEQFVMLVHYQAHPPVVMLARRRLSLAGLRLDPAIGGRATDRGLSRPVGAGGTGRDQTGVPPPGDAPDARSPLAPPQPPPPLPPPPPAPTARPPP